MAHKFIITGDQPAIEKPESPVLYNIYFGGSGKYYLHKGKTFHESLNKFLEEVTRGAKDMYCSPHFKKAAEYCKNYPGVNKVSVEMIYNGTPAAILSKEKALLQKIKKDPNSLNDPTLDQLRPEWMLKDIFQKRCEACMPSGIVDGKKIKFRFCPNCGHLNK